MNDTATTDPTPDGTAGPFSTLGQRPAAEDPPPQASDVGTLLCATRMRMGKDLQDIAGILHIRYNFLVAIEDGRYEDLPGQAYAIGFVRAYADHLGLDGDEVVRRYKEETAGIKRAVRYEYPIPPPESGIPSGALLMIAVVLGMMIYGVWYSMADADRRAADVIQEIPERLSAMLRSDEPAPADVAESAVAEPSSSSVEEDEGSGGEAAGTLVANKTPEPVAPTPAPVVATPAPAVIEPPKPAPQPVAVASAPAATPTIQPKPVAATPPPAVTTTTAPTPTPAAPKPTPAAPVAVSTPTPVATPAATPPKPAPTQVAAAGKAAAVELRAKSDSWIQVRDGEQLLLTRFLRKGESYRVPERQGLTLMTLNAGGVEILVDGQSMPPLGDAGSVARGVSLDAAKLKAMPKPAATATPPASEPAD